jgi:predicted ester cyclase
MQEVGGSSPLSSTGKARAEVSDMENGQLPQAGVDAFNARDAEAMRKLYAPDATITNPDSPVPMSVDEMINGFDTACSSFPDAQVSLGTVVADGQHVAFEMTWKGTHHGPLVMPDGSELAPTGLTISLGLSVMLDVSEGLIQHERQYYDNLGVLDQLGVA